MWVWILEGNFVRPGKVIKATCPVCGRMRVHTPSYQFSTLLPLAQLKANAVVYVPPLSWESNSGLSYEKGGDFFCCAENLKIYVIPKTLGDDVQENLHVAQQISHFTDHTIIGTDILLNPNKYCQQKQSICWSCLLKQLPPPPYKQGNLQIWKVTDADDDPTHIFFYKVTATGEHTSGLDEEKGTDCKIFNHILSHILRFWQRDETFYAFFATGELIIKSPDHDELIIPPADHNQYIAYHPYPTRAD